jgi:hypothetical protein
MTASTHEMQGSPNFIVRMFDRPLRTGTVAVQPH